MLNYDQWLWSAENLQDKIEEFFKETQFLDQEEVTIPDIVPTAETLYTRQQLEHFCHELEEAFYQVKRLNAEVVATGKLRKGENGRFWLGTEELASGRSVEILFRDKDAQGDEDIEYWHAGRIAHNGSRYYFTGDRNLELEGVRARIKKHL